MILQIKNKIIHACLNDNKVKDNKLLTNFLILCSTWGGFASIFEVCFTRSLSSTLLNFTFIQIYEFLKLGGWGKGSFGYSFSPPFFSSLNISSLI